MATNGIISANLNDASTRRAGEDLSELLKRKFGVKIDPLALSVFVSENFSRLSVLAHTIHEAPTDVRT